ncbi:MAG: SPFH domain-containing protein [Planctomycetota bacterium]|jgi:regulator of protease activity HflC (stomatin/prohibitin superfamily)
MAKIPAKRAENVAIAGIALMVLFLLISFITASYCKSAAAMLAGYFFLSLTFIEGISWLHLRSIRNADEESRAIAEAERVRKEQGRQRIFDSDQTADGAARSRLREMEKYGTVIAGLLILIYQAIVGSVYFYALIFESDVSTMRESIGLPLQNEQLSNTAFGAAAAFGISFVCFLYGKYSSGMSRIKNFHILRAGAGFTLFAAIINLLISAAFLFGYYGHTYADHIAAVITTVGMMVISLEMLINLVLDFYRPRMTGALNRPVYESRITALLAEPQGIFKTFSHTIDYQFGFNVSETWFFKFLNKAIAPLILFQLATLYLLSSIVIIEPGEVGVVERWGRPRGVERLPEFNPAFNGNEIANDKEWDKLETPLEAGFHLKFPWPIESIKIVKRDQVRKVQIGASQKDIEEHKNIDKDLITWDEEHLKGEFNYAMPLFSAKDDARNAQASSSDSESSNLDVMFVSGSIVIHYVVGREIRHTDGNGAYVKPGDVYRYLYRYSDPEKTLISLAEREVTRHMAGADFWDVLVVKAADTEKNLKEKFQQAADMAGLGIRIVFVSLSNVHPPVGEVGKAYQEVVAAKQEKETIIYKAKGEAAEKTANVPGDAAELINKAEGYFFKRAVVSKAVAARFANQLKAFKSAPSTYLHRERMKAIEDGLSGSQKIILVPQNVTAVIDDKKDAAAAAIDMAITEETSKEDL